MTCAMATEPPMLYPYAAIAGSHDFAGRDHSDRGFAFRGTLVLTDAAACA
jgi:hypothetical protein